LVENLVLRAFAVVFFDFAASRNLWCTVAAHCWMGMQRVCPWHTCNLSLVALQRSCRHASAISGSAAVSHLHRRIQSLRSTLNHHQKAYSPGLYQSGRIRSLQPCLPLQSCPLLHSQCRRDSRQASAWPRCQSRAAATDVAEAETTHMGTSTDVSNVIGLLRARGLIQVLLWQHFLDWDDLHCVSIAICLQGCTQSA
jgi:hypothetical protein